MKYHRPLIIGLASAALLIAALAATLLWPQGDKTSAAVPVSAPPATTFPLAAASPASAGNTSPPPATEPTTATSAPSKIDLVDWAIARNGCTVEQDGAKIHITGTNIADGWGRDNAVATVDDYPVQDFELSTDVLVTKLNGPSMGTVILRAREANFNQITLQYYAEGHCYMLRRWTTAGEEFAKTTLREFGDESTASHRMRLKYDAATRQATGWIDDKLVGTLNFELKTNLRFVMGASTDKKGYQIDLTLGHPTLTLSNKPVASDTP